jgi:hypothetical protein
MRQLSMIRLSGPYDPNIGTELGARIRPSIVPLLPARLLYCRGNDAAEGVPSNARRGPEQPAIFSDRARGRFFCRSRRCVAPCSYFGVYKGAGSAAANSRCRCTLSGAGLGGFNRRCSGQGWCSGTLSRSGAGGGPQAAAPCFCHAGFVPCYVTCHSRLPQLRFEAALCRAAGECLPKARELCTTRREAVFV